MKAMIRRRSVVVRSSLVAAVVAGAVVPLVLGTSTPVLASTLDGAAVLTTSALAPLSSGGSTTQFSVALPPTGTTPAACSGDTASGGYHVYSYLVQQGTSIPSLTFTSHPSSGLGLVNNAGIYYGSANTALHTGQIISIPTNFEFAALLSDGATLSQLLYSGSSGVWEAGLACATSSGALSDYWNVPVTFTSSGSDPNGFVWSVFQTTPQITAVTPASTASFSQQLTTANASGAVTYTTTGSSTALSVSSSGHVTTTGVQAVGAYTASGTDTDTGGDSGTWSFTLSVTPATLAQGNPKTGSTTPPGSAGFTSQLAASGGVGTLSYSVGSETGLAVSSTGAVSTTGAPLTAGGHYTASGTDADSYGDTGTWSFTLTVTPATLTQSSPLSASTTNTSSGAFTDQLAVSGASGTVTYTVGSESSGNSVSSSGAVSTTGALLVGTYTASGTDSDAYGDTGTWSFTLTVTGAPDTFTSASSTSVPVGQALEFSVTTSGSATKIAEKGKLPKGVKFNKATDVLGGTPTSTRHKSAAGTYNVSFVATFGKGKSKVTATQPFTLTVQ